MKQILRAALLMGLLATGLSAVAAQEKLTPDQLCEDAVAAAQDPETRQFDAAEQVLEDNTDYQAIFCTDVGAIYVDLFETETPITVNSFVFLAQRGYYNNSIFHRVLPGFMAQGGDPVGNPIGTGGPGYQFQNEPVDDLVFDAPGKLAMTNAGPNTNGSQFFITTAPADYLNGSYTLFGEVITGQYTVDSIMLRNPQFIPPDAPATVLHTVVIIDDPSKVDPVEVTPQPAAREDVERVFGQLPTQAAAMMDSFAEGLSTVMAVDPNQTLILDTETWVAQFPEASQTALSDYYTSHNHEYHADATITNSQCDLSIFPMAAIGYGMDAYPTAEDAAAALADETLVAVQEAQGFAAYDAPLEGYQFYTQTVSACQTEGLTHARGLWQVGRFVITGDVIYPAGSFLSDAAQEIQLLISDFDRGVFEGALRTLLIPEAQ